MSPIARQLERRVSGVRAHLRRRLAVAVTMWSAAGVALAGVVAWLAVGPGGWRQGSDVPLAIDLLVGLLVVVAWAVFALGARRWFDDVPLAATIERSAGLGRGTVRGSLELARRLPKGVSRSLADRAAVSAAAELHGYPDRALAGGLGAGLSRWTRRGWGALAVTALALMALTLQSPSRAGGAWAGLKSPFLTMIDPVPAPIVVAPGTIEVPRGSDVQLTIMAEGRPAVVLAWQMAGDVARTARLGVLEGRAAHVFRSVSSPIEYHVRAADGTRTEVFNIVPVDPLFVSDLIVDVEYPAYTGLPPEEYHGAPPPLTLLRGTKVSIEGRSSRPLGRAELIDDEGAPVLRLTAGANGFSGSWRPTRGGKFTWAFLDARGEAAEIQPDPLQIELVIDSIPLITIPVPGADTTLPLDLKQPLVLEARDDYGLDRIELVAYRVTAFGDRREPVVQALELEGTRAALARPLLDLSTWGLMPGDTVRYFARAFDGSPAGQAAVTREYVLRVPAAAQMRRAAEGVLDGAAERLEQLADEAARQAEANRDQAREAAARDHRNAGAREGAGSAFEDRQELQRALESQEALAAQVDSLHAQLEALERTLQEAGQADPQLAGELAQLQKLLNELGDEGVRRSMEQLAESLARDDLNAANRSLEQMAGAQEQLRERLEASLERFRRAAVEQDFRATTSEAEELARQERALADALKAEDATELRTEQQAALAERAQELEGSMQNLEERLRELGEEAAAEGVEQARQNAAESRQQMQQAEQQASRGEGRSAGEQAEQAAEELDETARELQRAQQQMAQQRMEAAQRTLGQAADDALSLARRQDELRRSMRGARQEELAGMRGDQASLLQGVRNLAENLREGTEGQANGNRELSEQTGRALESLERTLRAMEERRGGTPSPSAQAEQAVQELNRLALMAMEGASLMAEQGPGQGQSGQQVSEQLEQLAQQQGQLMNQTGQLMPLQLGEQAMARQLQEISQSQQAVSEQLGELAEEPGADESLGDLRELALEAEALARELAQGRLQPETVRGQERLFHRLLDAGRTLEREELSEDREAKAPGAFERGTVLPLSADQLGVMPYELPDGEQLRRLSPAVRQLVLEYFERLNREGPTRASDPPPPGGAR